MEPVHSVLVPVSGYTSGRGGMRLFSLLSCSPIFWGWAKEFFIFSPSLFALFRPWVPAGCWQHLHVPLLHKGTVVQLWHDQLWGHLGLPWLKDLVPLGEELRSVLLVYAACDIVHIAYCELLLFFWCLCPGDWGSYCWLTMYENSISKCKHHMLKSLMQRAPCRVNHS